MAYFQELHSEEIQEILARPPRWVLRWGITAIAGVLALLIFSTYLIQYPDLVRAPFKLTSVNIPQAVLARTNDRLIHLLANNGQTVAVGSPLAYLESTANHEQVLELSRDLNKIAIIITQGNLEKIDQLHLSNYNHLGELQATYEIFDEALKRLQACFSDEFFIRQKIMLQQELTDLQNTERNLRQQCTILTQNIRRTEENYSVQRRQRINKFISRPKLVQARSKAFSHKLLYRRTQLALEANLTAQRIKQKELLASTERVAIYRNKFLQASNVLRNTVDTWKASYIITAPVTGRLLYVRRLQKGQFVTIGQELFYVVPPRGDYVGELYLPQENAGKVIVGQEVIIKFTSFPYQEYGVVRGRITAISEVPLKDGILLAEVGLPIGLITDYGKSLTYRPGMVASAEIITANGRLIEKLFYNLQKATTGS